MPAAPERLRAASGRALSGLRGAWLPRLRGSMAEARDLASDLRRLRRERAIARPRPPASGLVLDLGAGHAPSPRADVVVDKYVADDFERGFALGRTKPLIVADGHHLPFRDDSFAYLIAAHVIEHATDPTRFAAEISRVARAGFVQVPTRLAERAFTWPFHPWLIDREGDELVFRPKPPREEDAGGEDLHSVYAASALFRLFFFSHRSAFHHTVHWEGSLRVRVDGSSRAARTATFDMERTVYALRHEPCPPLQDALLVVLRCPGCRRQLAERRPVLECRGCGRAYPVVGSVPLLLEEAANGGGAHRVDRGTRPSE